MPYVSFLDGAGAVRPALLDGALIRPFPARIATLIDYIALEPAARAALPLEAPVPLASVTLAAPLRPRKNVFCVGRNYMGHAEEVARASGRPLEPAERPDVLHQGADRDRRARRDAPPLADVSPEYD